MARLTYILVFAFALPSSTAAILHIPVLDSALHAETNAYRRARDQSLGGHPTRCLGRQRPGILLVEVLPAGGGMSGILTRVRS